MTWFLGALSRLNAAKDVLKPAPSKPAVNSKFPANIIASAQASQRKWRVPASVSLAQWGVESAYGKAVTGKFNYGGITAKVKDAVFPFVPGTPLEPATLCWTHEHYKGEDVKCQRWFKDFPNADAFFDAHGKLLGTSPIYAPAMAALPNVIKFINLMAPHYATAPNYGATLRSIIASNNLTQFDEVSA
jgi:flagellum-specific peptidoglycan hydrolase FlgJ